MDMNKVNQDLKIGGLIAATKDLPELEKQLWNLRTNDTAELVNLGILSAEDRSRLQFLRNIQTCIDGTVEKAGKEVPTPDLETNPEYPKEFIEAKKRLAELEAPVNQLKAIREALYKAGPKAYHNFTIYDDPALADQAAKLEEKVRSLRLPISDEIDELTGYIERHDRVNSKVRTIRNRIWREYEAKVNFIKDLKRSELEAAHRSELAEIKIIETKIELARHTRIEALALRVKGILEAADEILKEAA